MQFMLGGFTRYNARTYDVSTKICNRTCAYGVIVRKRDVIVSNVTRIIEIPPTLSDTIARLGRREGRLKNGLVKAIDEATSRADSSVFTERRIGLAKSQTPG